MVYSLIHALVAILNIAVIYLLEKNIKEIKEDTEEFADAVVKYNILNARHTKELQEKIIILEQKILKDEKTI